MYDSAIDLAEATEARAVARAIDVMAADIIRNASRRYPPGHPVRDLPSIATAVEYQFRRGRLQDARLRAQIVDKYIALYEPREEEARSAKDQVTRRMRAIVVCVR